MESNELEKIASLCKRRGFLFQGSELYGGLSGTWDYGPMGVLLKNNLKREWWRMFVLEREDMFGIDAAILMNAKVWEASGHIKNFVDPLIDCRKCKMRFREDMVEVEKGCPHCGAHDFTPARPFNMMFKTHSGPVEESAAETYLRPETAQGIFVNFKNVIDAMHPKLPFGIAQIGKAFRNEITPGNFIFRLREFEQMEIEYFVRPEGWQEHFNLWRDLMHDWTNFLGIEKHVRDREVAEDKRAHYSQRTIDIDFDYPFGREELYGLAYRGNFDLKNHGDYSGVELSYFDEVTKQKIIPHVIEPTFGLDRTILALLLSAFREEKTNDETRTLLALPAALAPITIAVFPLLANKALLIDKAKNIFYDLKKHFVVAWDDIGNIGKRYRRQDEIGTPWCVTIDFQTLADDTVTVRDRDTMKQERVAVQELALFMQEKLRLNYSGK